MTAVLDHMVGAGGWLWRGVALSVAVAVSALPAHAYDLTVPSGQIVTLDEQLVVAA